LREFWEGITNQSVDLIGGELGSVMARATLHARPLIK
jgi:hypothetical protein